MKNKNGLTEEQQSLMDKVLGDAWDTRNALNGIQLIAKERQEQIEKHGRTQAHDIIENNMHELSCAASAICLVNPQLTDMPEKWDADWCLKMIKKPYKERLIISGALIAAELDRIIYNEKDTVEVDEEAYEEITRKLSDK